MKICVYFITYKDSFTTMIFFVFCSWIINAFLKIVFISLIQHYTWEKLKIWSMKIVWTFIILKIEWIFISIIIVYTIKYEWQIHGFWQSLYTIESSN